MRYCMREDQVTNSKFPALKHLICSVYNLYIYITVNLEKVVHEKYIFYTWLDVQNTSKYT